MSSILPTRSGAIVSSRETMLVDRQGEVETQTEEEINPESIYTPYRK
jgi:hypothetical protein